VGIRKPKNVGQFYPQVTAHVVQLGTVPRLGRQKSTAKMPNKTKLYIFGNTGSISTKFGSKIHFIGQRDERTLPWQPTFGEIS